MIPDRQNSFLVRIWWEDVDSRSTGRLWRGWIQHVASGDTIYVQDTDALLMFIERWTGHLASVDGDTTETSNGGIS